MASNAVISQAVCLFGVERCACMGGWYCLNALEASFNHTVAQARATRNALLPVTSCLFEDALREVPQAVSPVRRVVAVAVHVPDMRYPLFLEVGMHALADVDQTVLVATG